jgi:hypothetical protein
MYKLNLREMKELSSIFADWSASFYYTRVAME